MNTHTLYQHFVNEKALTMQMLYDMSYLDTSLFDWQFCNSVVIKLCYSKNSLLSQITLKKIPLTENDKIMLNNIFTIVFSKSQIFELLTLP